MQNVTQGVYDNGQGRDVLQEPSDVAVAFSLALWVVTIAVGVPGNALMTVTIGYTASLRTAMNTYLLSIGVVDFLTCALLLPLRVYVNHIERTQKAIPHGIHRAELFIRTGTEAARLLLMLSLSVERYQAIARPFSVSKVQASLRALIVSGFTCGAAVLVSALAMHYFCDSVLFIHCLRDDSDSTTRWGTLELYVELPLTIASVLAIAVSYSLIVVVLRQQSRKMRGHSKAKPTQVVPVALRGAGGAPPLKQDTLKLFVVQETQTAGCNDVSRHTEATDSTTADSEITPALTDNKREPPHSPPNSTPMNVETDQEELCHTKPEEKDLSDANKLVCPNKLGIIPEVTSALEISSAEETNSRTLRFVHNLTDRIFVSSIGSNDKMKTTEPENKQILTGNLETGVYIKGHSTHLPPFSRPDSPNLSRCKLLKTPSLTSSSNSIQNYSTQGVLLSRRSSFHGFVNSFGSPEIVLDKHNASELPYLHCYISTSKAHTNNAETVGQERVGFRRNPFLRSSSELSTLKYPTRNYLCHLLHSELIFPKTGLRNIGNANYAQAEFSIAAPSAETPCEMFRPDVHFGGALGDTIKRSSCHTKTDQHNFTDPTQSVSPLEQRVMSTATTIFVSKSGDNFQKQTDSITENANVSKDNPTQDLEASVILNKPFDQNVFVTTAAGNPGDDAIVSQEDIDRCDVALEEHINPNESHNTTDSSMDCKAGVGNVQITVGLDTEPNIITDTNNQSVQNSETVSVTAIANTTEDTPAASGKKSEESKLVEVVEMDGTVRIEVQPEATAGQFDGAVCLMNPRNKEQGRRRVELKAALKVGLLFCTYVCLWAPLPVLVVYMRETYGWREKLKLDLLVVFSSLATSTAAVDPIIYGLLNRQIRSAAVVAVKKLKKKLRERFRSDI